MQTRSGSEDKLAKTLQLTSSACAIAGGTILAANIPAISRLKSYIKTKLLVLRG
ncbi:hypothetical protein [Chamaesiphon sp.]|uniref:hypothetical protein n=1 Tax=Chamaesiphon sp. TaxID=2814140 RepID=UPI0035946907